VSSPWSLAGFRVVVFGSRIGASRLFAIAWSRSSRACCYRVNNESAADNDGTACEVSR
jgi:hypothetical protein